MLLVNRLRKLSERFIRPVVPVVVALALAIAATACTLGPAPTGDIISGVVQGQDGPEAGVWVIAETDALGTGFAKIVVTDEDGRFVLPELPEASYDVWVREYGLADSEPVAATPDEDLVLTAVYPETPQEQAAVYPASYWYSLLEVPARQRLPGHRALGERHQPLRRVAGRVCGEPRDTAHAAAARIKPSNDAAATA